MKQLKNGRFVCAEFVAIVVRKDTMQFVFDYVFQTYGRNFIRLYE